MNVMCSFLLKFDYVPVDCKLANASHLMKVSKKALKNCWPMITTSTAGKLVEIITSVKWLTSEKDVLGKSQHCFCESCIKPACENFLKELQVCRLNKDPSATVCLVFKEIVHPPLCHLNYQLSGIWGAGRMWFDRNAEERGSWCVTASITGCTVGTGAAFTLCILLVWIHGVPLE